MGQNQQLNKKSSIDSKDIICQYPQELGKGYYREIQLREGLDLAIENHQLHDDLIIECPERQHPLEFFSKFLVLPATIAYVIMQVNTFFMVAVLLRRKKMKLQASRKI